MKYSEFLKKNKLKPLSDRQEIELNPDFILSNKCSNDDILCALYKKPILIRRVRQTHKACAVALRADPGVVKYIKSESIRIKAIKDNSKVFKHIKKPTRKMLEVAIKKRPYDLGLVKNPPLWLRVIAVKQNPRIIHLIKQNKMLCELAIKLRPAVISSVINPTQKMLKYVLGRMANDFSSDKSVQFVFRNIKKIDDGACIKILKTNGMYLNYIKNQTEKMCVVAIKHDMNAINCVHKKTEDILKLMLSKDGLYLDYIDNQTVEMCEIAVKQNKEAIKYIDKSIFEKEDK